MLQFKGYKIAKGESVYFLTFTIVGWVDLFTRKVYRDIVIESFRFCQENKGLDLFAYVIMSNHLHLIARSREGDLSSVVRDFKSYTSLKFLEAIDNERESRRDWMKVVFGYHGKFAKGQDFKIWRRDNHAEVIFSEQFFKQKLNYIHNNPVKAGIVERPEHYLYSSARNYAGLDALLDVIVVKFAQ